MVFARDGYRCQSCGRAGKLECDHISPDWQPEDDAAYDPDACQTLCGRCHADKTREENRREPTPEEAAWRAFVEELITA